MHKMQNYAEMHNSAFMPITELVIKALPIHAPTLHA